MARVSGTFSAETSVAARLARAEAIIERTRLDIARSRDLIDQSRTIIEHYRSEKRRRELAPPGSGRNSGRDV